MHTKITLQELMERAQAASTGSGPRVIAERLLLFGQIVELLEKFVDREASLTETTRAVRALARQLSAEVRKIEQNPNTKAPTIEQISDFYKASSRLSVALAQLERLAREINL